MKEKHWGGEAAQTMAVLCALFCLDTNGRLRHVSADAVSPLVSCYCGIFWCREPEPKEVSLCVRRRYLILPENFSTFSGKKSNSADRATPGFSHSILCRFLALLVAVRVCRCRYGYLPHLSINLPWTNQSFFPQQDFVVLQPHLQGLWRFVCCRCLV